MLFLALWGRLAWLQLYQGEELAGEAIALRTRQIDIREYPRGEILDRNGLPLTDATLTTALYVMPDEMLKETPGAVSRTGLKDGTKLEELSSRVAECLNRRNPSSIKRSLIKAGTNGAAAVRVASDLSGEETNRIKRSELPGLLVAPAIKRYGEDGLAVHLLGYVGEGDSFRGMAGLEKTHDGLLREAQSAPRLVSLQDARGMAIKGSPPRLMTPASPSLNSVVLTIDKRVQQTVEKAMNSRVGKGAVVVMDVRSKEILAMASRPLYNPYTVEQTIKSDRNGSLNNRALMAYPPGSLFKLLVAVAALEEGVVKTDETFSCTGQYRFNDQVAISCWKKEGHGAIRFADAFAQSCNSVFIETGLRLGRERLEGYVKRVHLDNEDIGGFNYGSSGSGVLIDGGPAAQGNASIGQQGVMLSPLQLCSLVATIADHGRWGQPSLVSYTVDSHGQRKYYAKGETQQVIKRETAETVQGLMVKTVRQGTGVNAAPLEVAAAGKTGTGQTGNLGRDQKEILNSWFAGYFPAEKPHWAVVVLVEESRSGAQDAAPVFKNIAEEMVKTLGVNENN